MLTLVPENKHDDDDYDSMHVFNSLSV